MNAWRQNPWRPLWKKCWYRSIQNWSQLVPRKKNEVKKKYTEYSGCFVSLRSHTHTYHTRSHHTIPSYWGVAFLISNTHTHTHNRHTHAIHTLKQNSFRNQCEAPYEPKQLCGKIHRRKQKNNKNSNRRCPDICQFVVYQLQKHFTFSTIYRLQNAVSIKHSGMTEVTMRFGNKKKTKSIGTPKCESRTHTHHNTVLVRL